MLNGSDLTEDAISKAARAAISGASPLRENTYKPAMFQGMLQEELLKARGAATA